MKTFALLLFNSFIFLFVNFSHAQFGFIFSDSIQVKKGGNTLEFPWAGGLNHAQFSTIDVDFDGMEDLFIFDRSANQIRIFKTVLLNGVKSYQYLNNTRDLFPKDIRYKATMVDFNGDGKKDIFTYGIGGVKVYRNIGNAAIGLQWILEKSVLQSIYSNGNLSNLYVSSIDIPAFTDVDGDGDTDVLTFNIGGQQVEYHKNTSMENYGIPDSLEFQLEDACWGKFIESDTDNNIQLNSNVGPCDPSNITFPQNGVRHAGSSLLALDLNNDNALDLILGDVSHYNLTSLTNGALPNEEALMTAQDPNFPSNTTPVNLPIFPAPFYIDVNHDGIKDLVIGTNASGGSENLESVWYYQNLGSNSNPNFSYVKKNFLQDQMIENGKGSIPVLIDLNNDGLKDLLVASNFRFLDPADKISKIQYYQNTGTVDTPAFTFISDDWLSLSNGGYGLRMHPAFGDLNGNGQVEMIIGTSAGNLHLYNKTGNGPENFVLDQINMTDNLGQVIQVGAFASPQIFDLNNDGLLDIIIGEKNAGLTFYKNIGTPTLPSFELITNDLGQIDMGEQFIPDNYSVPAFVRHNDTTHLFIGNRKGSIYYYREIDENLEDGDSFSLLSDNYSFINTGAYSAPFIDKIHSDGRYSMFVGTDLGGIWSYIAGTSSDLILSINELEKIDKKINIHPNPSKTGLFTINLGEIDQGLNIGVYDNLGQLIKESKQLWGHAHLDLSNSAKGVYTVIFKSTTQFVSTKRIVIQ
ncbi:T9SS type A sorting domain-containing protein [Brumimicrobium mesophilum]|uniref:T9SS type A sorting domain-containing protein n=1 Tax=Brumimicrobium mesophilum TaxID=392717 RepID=UPI00131D6EF9|nr:T9SS type A sorting domain-containing protein [Brumimicrobium mesophilum]